MNKLRYVFYFDKQQVNVIGDDAAKRYAKKCRTAWVRIYDGAKLIDEAFAEEIFNV